MAKQTVVTIVDDLDGVTEGAETVTFALDGKNYEIDLSPANTEALVGALAPFIEKARQPGAVTQYKRGPVTVLPASDAGAVRAWAKAQGLEVPQRGRIPAALRDRYYAAKA